MQAYQAPGYAPNPMGTIAVVATGLMAGAGIVGFVAGALTLRDARGADIPAPVEPTARRRRRGGGGSSPPSEEPKITCGKPSSGMNSCDQYVIQHRGHTAIVDYGVQGETTPGFNRIRILGRDALLTHEANIRGTEYEAANRNFRFPGVLCHTTFCKEGHTCVPGEPLDSPNLENVPADCDINAGVRYALDWIDENA